MKTPSLALVSWDSVFMPILSKCFQGIQWGLLALFSKLCQSSMLCPWVFPSHHALPFHPSLTASVLGKPELYPSQARNHLQFYPRLSHRMSAVSPAKLKASARLSLWRAVRKGSVLGLSPWRRPPYPCVLTVASMSWHDCCLRFSSCKEGCHTWL